LNAASENGTGVFAHADENSPPATSAIARAAALKTLRVTIMENSVVDVPWLIRAKLHP
jgi:hypothetical protein